MSREICFSRATTRHESSAPRAKAEMAVDWSMSTMLCFVAVMVVVPNSETSLSRERRKSGPSCDM